MNPPLSDRLRWTASGSPTAATLDRALMARYGGYLYGVGGTLALLLALLSGAARDEAALIAVALLACCCSAVLFVWFDRLPHSAFQVLVASATGLISLGLYFGDQTTGAAAVLYTAVACWAFHFFGRREAILQVAFIGVCFGVVLLAAESFSTALAMWLVTIAATLLVGILAGQARERVERLAGQLVETAQTDELTGLFNRRGFNELFELELERARRGAQVVSLLVGDLDRFKEINDRFGHQAGDEALKRLSAVFREGRRKIDLAARMGGEEFALVLPDTTSHGAYMVAERLRAELGEEFEVRELPLSISFGIATFPTHGKSLEELLKAADQALYAAKALGRNRSVIHSPEIAGTLAGVTGPLPEADGHLATVLALAETIDVRDQGTAKHSRTVGRYAELAARELGLRSERVERVRLAGILHDVGKVGVPDSILKKPGPLTEDEWESIRRHPEVAGRILEASGLDDIRAWIMTHHERPDGRGYPRGLMGDEIPLEAKILAVANGYEAMLTPLPYRPAHTPASAREELRAGRGTQFDGRVVDAFLRALERNYAPPASSGEGRARANPL